MTKSHTLDGLRIALQGRVSDAWTRKRVRERLAQLGARLVPHTSPSVDLIVHGASVTHTQRFVRPKGARVLCAAQCEALLAGAPLEEVCRLEGATLVLAGRTQTHSRTTLAHLLRARGARVARVVSLKTDAVVALDARAKAAVHRAQERGVPVLGEAELEALLGGATLEETLEAWERRRLDAEPAAFNEALARLRAAAHDAPSAQTWEAICAQLDTCGPDTVLMAVDYVEQVTRGWPEALDDARLRVSAVYGAAPTPVPPAPHEELRAMPKAWVREALSGQDHPKFTAARVLSYRHAKVNNALGAALVGCPSLRRLRGLYLGANRLSIAFCKALAEPGVLPELEALGLSGNAIGDRGLGALVKASWWRHVQAVGLAHGRLSEASAAHIRALNAPSLRWLDLSYNDLSADAALAFADLPQLASLNLASNAIDPDAIAAMASRAWPALRALDVSNNPDDDGTAKFTLTASGGFPALETLRWDGGYGPAMGSGERRLFEGAFPKLHTLSLGLGTFGGDDLALVWDAPNPPPLRRLHITRATAALDDIALVLHAYPELEELACVEVGLERLPEARLARELPELPKLKRLSLVDNALPGADLRGLLRVPQLRGLEVLEVGYDRVGDAETFLKALLEYGPRRPALREVSLWGDVLVRCAPDVLERLLSAPGLEHVRRCGVMWDDDMLPGELIARFEARFGAV